MKPNKYTNEKSELLKIAYAADTSKRVRKRVLAVNMHLNGIDEIIIAKILGICDKSVQNYIKRYFEKGLLDLIQEKNYKPESEMEKYSAEIVENLEKEPCISIKECCSRIENITGLKRSTTQVSKFIKKKVLSFLKLVKFHQKQTQKNKKNF
jgi:transposase